MKKFLSLFTVLVLVISPTITVIACGDKSSTNNDKPDPEPIVKKDLTKIITKTDLGTYDHVLTNQEILTRLKSLNNELDISQVEVQDSQLGKAKIHVKDDSTIYESTTIDVNYVVLTKLSTIITSRDLGEFDDEPNASEIINRIKTLYPKADTTQFNLIIDVIEETVKVSVIPDSKVYFEETLNLIYRYLVNFDIKIKI